MLHGRTKTLISAASVAAVLLIALGSAVRLQRIDFRNSFSRVVTVDGPEYPLQCDTQNSFLLLSLPQPKRPTSIISTVLPSAPKAVREFAPFPFQVRPPPSI